VLLGGLGSGILTARLLERPDHAAAERPPSPASGSVPSPDFASPPASSWWKPLPTAAGPFVPAQIVIEKLHVQAPIEVKGLDDHNTMEAPDRPTDAAWYSFTAKPGAGSNAVFAGHRDGGQAGSAATFRDLDKLTTGDPIDVVSDRQTEFRYRVSQVWNYGLKELPMAQVLANDPNDEITLIAPSGAFVRGGYDHRLVVRGLRVP
jgi:LPXTG-site transpeptidase (sortase) family protein